MNGGSVTGVAGDFLKSLGFPNMRFHGSRNHFDFTHGERRILVIGPMGSGKTEFSAGIWRDARIAKRNLGLSIDDAPAVVVVGPGYRAGTDCHAVIETLQGMGMGSIPLPQFQRKKHQR